MVLSRYLAHWGSNKDWGTQHRFWGMIPAWYLVSHCGAFHKMRKIKQWSKTTINHDSPICQTFKISMHLVLILLNFLICFCVKIPVLSVLGCLYCALLSDTNPVRTLCAVVTVKRVCCNVLKQELLLQAIQQPVLEQSILPSIYWGHAAKSFKCRSTCCWCSHCGV